MKTIIDEIDKKIATCLGKGKFYGLCRLIVDKNGTYPVTIDEPQKVAPNDLFKLAIYHRRLDSSVNPDETNSFGRVIKKRNDQKLRTVVMIEEKAGISIESVYSSLPDFITIDGYKSVFVQSDITLIVDHDAIWKEEFGEAYNDKWQLRYKLYALEYVVEYIKCTDNVCN